MNVPKLSPSIRGARRARKMIETELIFKNDSVTNDSVTNDEHEYSVTSLL